jgi:hypothetical protein
MNTVGVSGITECYLTPYLEFGHNLTEVSR